jgi:hypothetical protein
MELGFFETNINGREVIAHLGDTEAFHSSLHLFLKDNVGVFYSFNSPGKGGAAGSLRSALFEDFADRYLPGPEVDTRVPDSTAAKHAAMMTGHWVNSRRSESSFINAIGLASQVKVSADKGQLVLPVPGLNGQPKRWVETAPFVWREANGHARLAAQVVGNKVVRFSFDEVSPFMVFEPAQWYKSAGLLLPLLGVSLAALALTALTWPVAAIVRRRYGAALALDPRGKRAFRLSRLAVIMILAALVGWAVTVTTLFSSLENLSASTDLLIRFFQVFGTIAFVGGFAVLAWHLYVVWSSRGRRWTSRVWSIVLAMSALVILWVAFAFKLISFGVNY